MKKAILNLAITTFIAGAMLTGCQSSTEKVENTKDKVVKIEQELKQAIKDSIQQFKIKYNEKIAANEKSFAEFKARIAKERKEEKYRYEKKLAELEQKNSDMKKNLEDYKEEGKEKWEKFKMDFNNEMKKLENSIKNLTTNKNKK